MCFCLLLLALLKTAHLAMKIAKLTRSSRVLVAEMAMITTGVKSKSKIECFVPVLGAAGRWSGESVRYTGVSVIAGLDYWTGLLDCHNFMHSE